MPELPEVEVITRGLLPHLKDRSITSIAHSGKNLRCSVPLIAMRTQLLKNRVTNVTRRAKYIQIFFEDKSLLILHLGMTGNLGIFPKDSPTAIHDHLQWTLDNAMELRYNDTRRFGSIHLFSPDMAQEVETTFFHRTGPEPLGPDCSASYLKKKAKNKTQPIKSFLMNAEIIAGVGNIYANETLFKALIPPSRPTGSLSLKEWSHILECLRETLNWAIECGGSTISDFINASGEQGYFQANFKVYGRTGSPCHNCDTPILKTQIGGRASFHCPTCQKKSKIKQ